MLCVIPPAFGPEEGCRQQEKCVISCPCLEKSTSRDILICQTEIKEGEMIVPYIANTESDRAEMLKAAGFSSLEDMWEKAGVRFPYPALEGIPEGKSEYEVVRHLEHLANFKFSCFFELLPRIERSS